MAIYHLEAKVVSRGTGRSAVAASAYMSFSRLYNDYDGIQHDYTRKSGLVWEHIFLPDYAPAAWQEREALWNAVEENEKAKDNRLARELVVALPVELDTEKQIALLTEYIQNAFVSDGMCADTAIHDTDGHNPHAHILLTVRPLNEDGTWQYKTEKEYLCVRNGEERGFTAAEYKAARNDGWEKQCLYKVGKRKAYLPPSEAVKYGYARVNKHPKSTRFGRQNPISERWNSEEQLMLWREAWAKTVNRALERDGHDTRIDHRSHATQGLDEQPTVHEGVIARRMEREGMVSDRCELNRQIRADNKLLRELKAQVKKLTETVRNTIPAIAEALETVRQNIVIFHYQLATVRESKRDMRDTLKNALPDMQRFRSIADSIKAKSKERKSLTAEKNELSPLRIVKIRELKQRIMAITEEISELQSQKAFLLSQYRCVDDADMTSVQMQVKDTESMLQRLEKQEAQFRQELNSELAHYEELTERASALDAEALSAARAALHPDKGKATAETLQAVYGERFSNNRLQRAQEDVTAMLGEEAPERQEQQSVRAQLEKNRRQQLPQRQTRNSRNRDERER